jgi:hypothetical protein
MVLLFINVRKILVFVLNGTLQNLENKPESNLGLRNSCEHIA